MAAVDSKAVVDMATLLPLLRRRTTVLLPLHRTLTAAADTRAAAGSVEADTIKAEAAADTRVVVVVALVVAVAMEVVAATLLPLVHPSLRTTLRPPLATNLQVVPPAVRDTATSNLPDLLQVSLLRYKADTSASTFRTPELWSPVPAERSLAAALLPVLAV